MKIVLLCEGKTERAFADAFKRFVDRYCDEKRLPRVALRTKPSNGRMTNGAELARRLRNEARDNEVVGVVALTDVYPDFPDAEAARAKLLSCVADSRGRDKFHAHAAQFDVEAWLLPFWSVIIRHLRLPGDTKPFGPNPEQIRFSSQKVTDVTS